MISRSTVTELPQGSRHQHDKQGQTDQSLLDQHVNRPGHVPATLAKAVGELSQHVDVADPDSWTDHEERELLELYLVQRAMTSMTDSEKRADAIKRAAAQGVIKDQRGSFVA